MNKVVANGCYGGFSLSQKALQELREVRPELVGEWNEFEKAKYIGFKEKPLYLIDHYIDRHNPALVSIVEDLGDEASGDNADLYVVEIPGNRYRIDEYDGSETIYWPEDDSMWTVIE